MEGLAREDEMQQTDLNSFYRNDAPTNLPANELAR